MILVYKDPKKKKLQMVELLLVILLLPFAVHWGGQAMQQWNDYQQAKIHFDKGHEYLHQESLGKARAELEKAVELYPEFYAAWEGLAVTYHFQGDHQGELKTYQAAAEALPGESRIQRELAQAYHEVGQHDKELEVIQIARDLDSTDDPLTARIHDRATRERAGTYPGSESVDDSVDWTESQEHY